MFTSAFDVVVEATLAERWTVSRLSERLVLRVAEDSEVDVVTGGRSVEDVRSPSSCTTVKEPRGRSLAGMTVVMDEFNVVAALGEFSTQSRCRVVYIRKSCLGIALRDQGS
jgi:hypothetical protein